MVFRNADEPSEADVRTQHCLLLLNELKLSLVK